MKEQNKLEFKNEVTELKTELETRTLRFPAWSLTPGFEC